MRSAHSFLDQDKPRRTCVAPALKQRMAWRHATGQHIGLSCAVLSSACAALSLPTCLRGQPYLKSAMELSLPFFKEEIVVAMVAQCMVGLQSMCTHPSDPSKLMEC